MEDSENIEEKNNENKIIINDDNENNEETNYKFLNDDKILGRFSPTQKLYIINKLNVIVYNRIKKELMIELKRKKLENKILLIKSRIKTNLISHKKLQSLIQQ